jgi:hypothetical protein
VNRIAAVEHPLTIAEIFDRAVVLCVRRWPYVVALSALDATPGVVTRAANGGREPTGDIGFYSTFAVEVLVSSVAFAALVRAFGEAGSRTRILPSLSAALRDFPRSVGAYLVLLVAFVVLSGIAAGLAYLGFVTGRGVAGEIGAIVASLALGLPALVLVAPLYVVMLVAYPTTILERRGPFHGFAMACKRVLSGDLRRGMLLGVAFLIATAALPFAVDEALSQVVDFTGQQWTGLVEPPLGSLLGAFSTALGIVAALDFRLRREGTDLQAVLESAAST